MHMKRTHISAHMHNEIGGCAYKDIILNCKDKDKGCRQNRNNINGKSIISIVIDKYLW